MTDCNERRTTNWAILGIAGLLAGTMGAAPAAGQLTFERVADLATPIPGHPGSTFEDLPDDPEDAPSAFGTAVLFWGLSWSDGIEGLYTFVGGARSKVVDTTDEQPGNPGNLFTNFGGLGEAASLADGHVAFFGASGGHQGTYLATGGGLSLVADEDSAVPGAPGQTFSGFDGHPSTSAGQVAFLASSSGTIQRGLYLFDGAALAVIADSSTPIPGEGGATFTEFRQAPSLDLGQIAFIGDGSSSSGIYFWNGSSLDLVANRDTPDPQGSAGSLGSFADAPPSLDDGQVAFRAQVLTPVVDGFDAHPGLYLWDGATVSLLVERGQARPGGGTFDLGGRTHVSLSERRVLFTDDVSGLFLWESGGITRILGEGDLLDGDTVEEVLIGPEALTGGCFTFGVLFATGDSAVAVYQACFPAPQVSVVEIPTLGHLSLLLLALALAGAALFTLRRIG